MAKKNDVNLKRKAIKAISPKKAKKKRTNVPRNESSSRQTTEMVEDLDDNDDIINVSSDDDDEVDDAGNELSTLLVSNRLAMDLHETERMSKHWTSPVYAFFEPIPAIEYVGGRCCHVFKCCSRGCKFTARRYLDKSDKSSTGNLIWHVKACWREDAWNAAIACRDADDARKSVTLPLAQNGKISLVFERGKDKGKIAYSYVQHTREETK
jgi:hypothetical protein